MKFGQNAQAGMWPTTSENMADARWPEYWPRGDKEELDRVGRAVIRSSTVREFGVAGLMDFRGLY
jgi:hypothetical protein